VDFFFYTAGLCVFPPLLFFPDGFSRPRGSLFAKAIARRMYPFLCPLVLLRQVLLDSIFFCMDPWSLSKEVGILWQGRPFLLPASVLLFSRELWLLVPKLCPTTIHPKGFRAAPHPPFRRYGTVFSRPSVETLRNVLFLWFFFFLRFGVSSPTGEDLSPIFDST